MKPMLGPSLKERTASHHQHLDSSPMLKRLVAPDLQRSEYKGIVTKMFGFFLPLEAQVNAPSRWGQLFTSYGLDLAARQKTGWMAADLKALHLPALAALPRFEPLAAPQSPGQAWAYLYLLEGATLGGQAISRLLQRSLQLQPDDGARFYYGYGPETRPMWQGFQQSMETWYADQDTAEGDEVVATSQSLYDMLAAWLRT